MKKKIFAIVTALVSFIVSLAIMRGLNQFILVPWNIHSPGLWIEFIVAFGITCFVCFQFYYNTDEDYHLVSTKTTGAITALLLVALIVASGFSWKLFVSREYSKLMKVETRNAQEDIVTASPETIVVVDQKTAQNFGDRTIGNIPNASWYDVDNEYNVVRIGDEYFRISPLEYSSFGKYIKASDSGIPGFVLVNAKASNGDEAENAQFVRLDNPMYYSPSAYWGHDLKRHLYYQYPTYMFADSYFEVDDEYTPYWITGVKTNTIGLFGGAVVNSFVITNAVTGESNEYSVEDLPEWVDQGLNVGFLMDQLGWHYRYFDGFWNGMMTKSNVYNTSYAYRGNDKSENETQQNSYTPFDGYNTVIGADGKVYFFTGITPDNKAETLYGYCLVSPTTSTAYFYECDGAEESSAQKQAEGLVSDFNYSASYPTIINVDGVETYFMTLKSGSGLVQKYALCNVKRYSICVVDDTISGVIAKYKTELGLNAGTDDTEELEKITVSGTVNVVSQAEIDGYTYYYFKLEGKNDVYMSSIGNSNFQPIYLVEGAYITIECHESSLESGLMIVDYIGF